MRVIRIGKKKYISTLILSLISAAVFAQLDSAHHRSSVRIYPIDFMYEARIGYLFPLYKLINAEFGVGYIYLTTVRRFNAGSEAIGPNISQGNGFSVWNSYHIPFYDSHNRNIYWRLDFVLKKIVLPITNIQPVFRKDIFSSSLSFEYLHWYGKRINIGFYAGLGLKYSTIRYLDYYRTTTNTYSENQVLPALPFGMSIGF